DRRARPEKRAPERHEADEDENPGEDRREIGRAHPEGRAHAVVLSNPNERRTERDVDQAGPEVFRILCGRGQIRSVGVYAGLLDDRAPAVDLAFRCARSAAGVARLSATDSAPSSLKRCLTFGSLIAA